MSNSSDHPQHQQLIDFGLGKLGPGQTSEIEEHLDHCDVCHETLLNLNDDTFTGLVRSLPDPGNDMSGHAATMVVQNCESSGSSELPAELRDHPRYRVIEQIGRGGMGDVYRAEHRIMNRAVALKLINSQFVQHPEAVKRFRREVQAAAQLTHPNIVTAFDAEQAGNVHFLVMEFVEGTDLATVIDQRGPLPVAEACNYIRQAASGLQHAHQKGMVHRDIKPHNLMLSPDGQIRILDFGLAGFATESVILDADSTGDTAGNNNPAHLTRFGSVMGTPDFIAPEQARDAHTADIRADVYSLGCTLCYLLSGRAPFGGESVVDKLKAHVDQAPPSLDVLREDVPTDLARVITRMMAKDPADRFDNPDDVAAALTPFVTNDAIVSDTSALLPPPRRGFRRWVTSPAAWIFTVLLSGVIYVVTDYGRIEIHSDVDVEISVRKDGKEINLIDVASGTSVRWLPTGEYQIIPKGNADVTLSQRSVVITRVGKLPITITSDDEMVMKRQAIQALQPFLEQYDAGNHGKFWDGMADFGQQEFTRDRFIKSQQLIHSTMGGVVERRIRLHEYSGSLPRVGKGHFVTIQYDTDFERFPNMREQFVLTRVDSSTWKVLSCFTTLPSASERNTLSDQQRLQGTWIAESGQRGGQAVPVEQIGIQRAVFAGDTLSVVMPVGLTGDDGMVAEGAFQLKVAANPKEIWIQVKGRSDGMRGIYRLDGDRLTLCMNQDRRGEVPSDFNSAAGPNIDVIVLRRHEVTTGSDTKAVATNSKLTPFENLLAQQNKQVTGNMLPCIVFERKGHAAFRFGKWLLVFEGVPCEADPDGADPDGAGLLGIGGFNYPLQGGRGTVGKTTFGKQVTFSGHWDGESSEITVADKYTFQILDKGNRVVFDDRGYDGRNNVQTIVIASDGLSRLEQTDGKQEPADR